MPFDYRSEYHRQDEISDSILEQITEEQVAHWLLARLIKTRNQGVPANNISITAHLYDFRNLDGRPFAVTWTGHALGECASLSHNCTDTVRQLREAVCTKSKAASKRAEAEKLMAEAAAIEAIANMNL